MLDTLETPISIPTTTEWLSPEQLAERLKVHKQSIYRAVRSGALVGVRPNRRDIRISTEAAARWLANSITA